MLLVTSHEGVALVAGLNPRISRHELTTAVPAPVYQLPKALHHLWQILVYVKAR